MGVEGPRELNGVELLKTSLSISQSHPQKAFAVGILIQKVLAKLEGNGKWDRSDLVFVMRGFPNPGGLFSRKPYS